MIAALRHFRVDLEQHDRVTVWIDVAERSVNVLFEEVFEELLQILDQPRVSSSELPLVFRSAKKKGFIVGADLRRILSIDSDSQIQTLLSNGQAALSRLEEFKGNTVAIIQGPCLGGGLEFAMACRFRFAIDEPTTRLGMPEAKLGLMPGWGGTQRLIEIVGMENGLPMLLDGGPIDAKQALEFHLVDGLLGPLNVEEQLIEVLDGLPLRTESKPLEEWLARKLSVNPTTLDDTFAVRGRTSQSQSSICRAIELGIEESREAGFRAERELFFELLSNPAVRESLKKFA